MSEKIESSGTFFPVYPRGISCVTSGSPASSFCVAVDSQGRTVSTIDPADGATAAWGKSALPIVGTNALSGMACPSAVLCVAVDSEGNAFTTADPGDGAGATWALKKSIDGSTHDFTGLTCSTPTFCVAVDSAGNVVTTSDPADGASATWTPDDVDGTNYTDGASCFSSSLCVVVDRRAMWSRRPTRGARRRPGRSP